MSEPTRLLEVAELDFALEPAPLALRRTPCGEHLRALDRLRKAKPALFNGRVLLLGRREIERARTER